MLTGTMAGLPQTVAAAVTPVVMVSAAAVLILGLNSKHQSMSDRVRTLAVEFRQASEERQRTIAAQAGLFQRRMAHVANGQRCLYSAVVCFLVMVLLIVFAPGRISWTSFAFVLFVAGSCLILAAVILEILELALANRTIQIELADVINRPGP
ncbi:MAG TPA: DUF2721 domain-containing protein [Bryobacteraceae bacterium]|nr:DUF2721 domain-containing protein [Bryobacteraceae bacterium]